MARPILGDAFDHHVWATLTLTDACIALSPEQLETAVPGTYGSIIETMRHLVDSDTWYLFRLSGERHELIEGEAMDLQQLRTSMELNGLAWSELVGGKIDPDEIVSVHREDGSETHAPRGIRIAQALHHGTDHRSQVCTALTSLGIEPPAIDVWDYGQQAGRVTEVEPTT